MWQWQALLRGDQSGPGPLTKRAADRFSGPPLDNPRIRSSHHGKKIILCPYAVYASSIRRIQMMATPLRMRTRPGIALAIFLGLLGALSGSRILSAPQNASAQIDPKLFQGLRYRN